MMKAHCLTRGGVIVADSYQLEVAELEAIVNRDADAFCRWFSRSDLSIRLSLRSFADVVDVEAIVQDAALQIWKEPFRILPDGRSGFLRRYATTWRSTRPAMPPRVPVGRDRH